MRRIAPLPDVSDAELTAYRIDTGDRAYFLKLRPGAPPPPLARHLADTGITQVPAPLPPLDARLPTGIAGRTAILYPYIEGENAFRRPLTEDQWTALGAAVRAIHDAKLSPDIAETTRHETYADVWRSKVRAHLTADAPPQHPNDEAARGLTQLLARERSKIAALIDHAADLAASLRRRDPPMVPCHGDLHAGNILVQPSGALMIVDWDDPVLAPKECDLMFVGAGIGGAWNRPEESAAFFRGYGPCAVDAEAIAYYRCERIVEDVAVYSDHLLREAGDPTDRAESLRRLSDAFAPHDVVDIAERTFAAL